MNSPPLNLPAGNGGPILPSNIPLPAEVPAPLPPEIAAAMELAQYLEETPIQDFDLDTFTKLLLSVKDPNVDFEGQTLLNILRQLKKIPDKVLQQLVQNGLIVDKNGEEPLLMSALKNGDMETVKELLELFHADPNTPNLEDPERNTPMHLAAKLLNFKALNLLLQNGGNPHVKNAAGAAPLLYMLNTTSAHEKKEMGNPGQIDQRGKEAQNTPNEIIALKKTIALLLDAGADPNQFPEEGGEKEGLAPALFRAVEKFPHDESVAKRLLEAGAKTEQIKGFEKTIIDWVIYTHALRPDFQQVVEKYSFILEGMSYPLHALIRLGRPLKKIISEITQTRINQMDARGKTPLACLLEAEFLEPPVHKKALANEYVMQVLNTLIDEGAEVNRRSADGLTPLLNTAILVAKIDAVDHVKLLLENQAAFPPPLEKGNSVSAYALAQTADEARLTPLAWYLKVAGRSPAIVEILPTIVQNGNAALQKEANILHNFLQSPPASLEQGKAVVNFLYETKLIPHTKMLSDYHDMVRQAVLNKKVKEEPLPSNEEISPFFRA